MDPPPLGFLPRGAGLFFLALALGSCAAPVFDPVCPIPADATPAQQVAAVCACRNATVDLPVPGYRRRKIDLL